MFVLINASAGVMALSGRDRRSGTFPEAGSTHRRDEQCSSKITMASPWSRDERCAHGLKAWDWRRPTTRGGWKGKLSACLLKLAGPAIRAARSVAVLVEPPSLHLEHNLHARVTKLLLDLAKPADSYERANRYCSSQDVLLSSLLLSLPSSSIAGTRNDAVRTSSNQAGGG